MTQPFLQTISDPFWQTLLTALLTFAQTNGISAVVLFVLIYFGGWQLWPWFKSSYWPAMLAERKEEAASRQMLTQAFTMLSADMKALPVNIVSTLGGSLSSSTGPILSELSQVKSSVDTLSIESRTRHEALLVILGNKQLVAARPNGDSAIA